MQAIPLGRVTVPTPGTPVMFAAVMSATQLAQVPPSNLVNKIEIWPDPAAVGKVFAKCQPPGYGGAVTAAALPVIANGYPVPWSVRSEGSGVDYRQYGLDAATANDGAFVTIWVD